MSNNEKYPLEKIDKLLALVSHLDILIRYSTFCYICTLDASASQLLSIGYIDTVNGFIDCNRNIHNYPEFLSVPAHLSDLYPTG